MKALALLLAAAAVLAGCTSNPLGGGPLTAKEAQGKADPAARQWRGDAVLVGIAAPEGGAGSAFLGNGSSEWPMRVDPDGSVGDGRLPQWILNYRSPAANASLAVVVYQNGTVQTHDDPESRGDDGSTPVANWQVDSPQAAQVAMQDANFSAAARAADGGIVYVLGQGNGGMQMGGNDPFWILTTGSESASTGAIVFINARTGERLNVPFFGGDFGSMFGSMFGDGGSFFDDCPGDTSSSVGTVTLQNPRAEHEVDFPEGCSAFEVELSWEGTLPTDQVTFELRDEADRVVETRDQDVEPGSYRGTFDNLRPGSYSAVVILGSDGPVGASADYSLDVTLR